MASRDDILRAIRAAPVSPTPLPEFADQAITYPDLRARFAESLKIVGGQCIYVDSLGQVDEALASLPQFAAATRVISKVPGVARTDVEEAAVEDPHALENIDVAIVRGHFGVAENAAVWVTDDEIKHRALLFIVQHLVLVLETGVIVNNMHEAYERLDFSRGTYGAFISGPSKTADIEQSLVIGAHGPRSLTVFVLPQRIVRQPAP